VTSNHQERRSCFIWSSK